MPFFGLEDVEAALRRAAEGLAEPVEAFVFGGGAMAAWGVKPATRDLDIAFREPRQRNAFREALVELKATRPPDRHKPGEGAREFYQTPDGMGWDLFLDNVIGFPLVAHDFRDAEPWFHKSPLDVRRLRPELVFIMKAFTPRTRDISDMYELLQTGLVSPDSIAATVRRRIGDDPTQP